MKNTKEKIARIDADPELRKALLPQCRLKPGEIWTDPVRGHKVGVLDAANKEDVLRISGGDKIKLMVNDPPYNVKVGNKDTKSLSKTGVDAYMDFSRRWVEAAASVSDEDSAFYVWLGTEPSGGFQPLPEFMIMMRSVAGFVPKNFITLRNQRGYGTQKNWMWVRQELLHYVKGNPLFNVVYTDIPKALKGYYKEVGGKVTENIERSKSDTIRPGNVWMDIQQVFYRMKENVPGCYAQKPLKAIERILLTSSQENDLVMDLFAHSGTTLIAGERLARKVYTLDSDPIFAEITIRRLERYRETGFAGWQGESPFQI